MDLVDLADDPRTRAMQPPSLGKGPAVAGGVIPKEWILGTDGQQYPANGTKGPVSILRYILRWAGQLELTASMWRQSRNPRDAR